MRVGRIDDRLGDRQAEVGNGHCGGPSQSCRPRGAEERFAVGNASCGVTRAPGIQQSPAHLMVFVQRQELLLEQARVKGRRPRADRREAESGPRSRRLRAGH